MKKFLFSNVLDLEFEEYENKYNRIWINIVDWIDTIIYVGAFYLIITILFVEGYQIPSNSMLPTFHGDPNFFKGDRIFALKAISKLWKFKRGDIIIFISVEDQKTFIVKRLVGLPGERIKIKDGHVWINGKKLDKPPFDKIAYETPLIGIPKIKTMYGEYYFSFPHSFFGKNEIKVPKDCYFVLGDNSPNSWDGRYWGFLPKRNVLGEASLIWWPISHARILVNPFNYGSSDEEE